MRLSPSGSDAKTYDVLDLAHELSKALTELATQTATVAVCPLKVARVFRRLVHRGSNAAEDRPAGAVDATDTNASSNKQESSSARESCSSNDSEWKGRGHGAAPEETADRGRGYGKILTAEEEQADEDECKLVVENYVGLVSLLHNATHLGYFKMRGKISF